MRSVRGLGREAAFERLMGEAGTALRDRVSAATAESRFHGWGGVPGYVRTSGGPGWALVGDAGYFKDPITAHGMTDAVRDAELLADAILDTVQGGVPEAVALARYQQVRDRLSSALFEVTEAVAAYDWDAETIPVLLRGVSAAMSDEVDHLMARPNRPDTAVVREIVRPDSLAMPR
jgi:flavin-dependent dehydrogenase